MKADLQFWLGFTFIYVLIAFLMLLGCQVFPTVKNAPIDFMKPVAEIPEQAW